MKRVLIVAGSDSGGGAGIQADLKTVSALGAWGTTAVTALTAQNSRGVAAIHAVPPAFIAAQIRAVLDDIGADAVKIGMLSDAAVVAAVADALEGAGPVILDPVMVAKGGARLLADDAVAVLKERLIPRAALLTPNIPEAEALAGVSIAAPADMQRAADALRGLGAGAVLVKGGHLPGDEVIDVLVDDGGAVMFQQPRVKTRNTHGTGCTLSAAVAALCAQGRPLREAVDAARAFVRLAMRAGPQLGTGHAPLDHLAGLKRDAQRHAVLLALAEALEALDVLGFAPLVPEVQTNLAFALPWAETPAEVAAFPGRIVRAGPRIHAVRAPAFGASRHVARIVLTAMRRDPSMRACINLRYSPEIVARLRAAGLAVESFDRRDEPADVKAREGSTLEWGTHLVLERARAFPDAVYDTGDVGKEPMVRVLGRDPADVLRKVRPLCGGD